MLTPESRRLTQLVKEYKLYADLSCDVDPEKLAPYIGITKRGALEFGIDDEKVLEVAGLVTESTA